MAVKIFKSSIHKPAVMQALREGMSPEKCAEMFPINVRTAYRYLKELRYHKEIEKGLRQPEPQQIKEPRRRIMKINIELEAEEVSMVLATIVSRQEKQIAEKAALYEVVADWISKLIVSVVKECEEVKTSHGK